jgi:hypothetical protein
MELRGPTIVTPNRELTAVHIGQRARLRTGGASTDGSVAPVRVIDAFVNGLDAIRRGIVLNRRRQQCRLTAILA